MERMESACFMAYSTATKLNKEEAEVQVLTLLTIIGAEAHQVFLTFQWEREADQRSVEKVIQKFGEYVQPKVNIAVERFKFNSRNQGMGELFNQYVTILRQMAARCGHDKITLDELLRDRIIFGIGDGKVRGTSASRRQSGSQQDTNSVLGIRAVCSAD